MAFIKAPWDGNDGYGEERAASGAIRTIRANPVGSRTIGARTAGTGTVIGVSIQGDFGYAPKYGGSQRAFEIIPINTVD